MLFDDKAQKKLDTIIHGAAVGETVGILANRMSEAERAEKLTPGGILLLSRQSDLTSTSAEILRATVKGLEAADAMGSPSNLDIRIHLHKAYRKWATTSPVASQFRNNRMTQAILSGQLGSFTPTERGASDGMLRAAPIGLAFASDPGRAFLIGAEAAAVTDGHFNSCLGAGVVALVVAVICNGMTIGEAVKETVDFIRPLDWPGEISEALRRVAEPESDPFFARTSASETLRTALSAVHGAGLPSEAITLALKRGDRDSASLAGQLTWVVARQSSTSGSTIEITAAPQ